MSDAPRLEGIALWRVVCAVFFEVPQDNAPSWPMPVLQGTMDAVLAAELGEGTGGVAPPAAEATNLDLEAGNSDEIASSVSALLWGLGARKGSTHGVWRLAPGIRTEMESVKNEVRKEAHRQKTRARIETYRKACRGFAEMAGSRASPLDQAESAQEASERLAIVQAFSLRWRADPATHSLINGLIRSLQTQRNTPEHCVRWMVNDAVFVEHPDVDGFTRSSLELLVLALGFSSELLGETAQASASMTDRGFVASASLSNPRITTVLKRLPAESLLIGACHGTVDVTDVARANTSGTLDGDYSNSSWMCQVL